MSDLIQSLLSAIETREIDMGECADMYAGITLSIRVNWTRAQKKRRWELLGELYSIRNEVNNDDADMESLNERAESNAAAWMKWWSEIMLMTADDMTQLRDTLPEPHWEWLLNRILDTAQEYEETEIKKVVGLRGAGSEKPAQSLQKSGKESRSQDGLTQSAEVPFSQSTTSI